ncbi:MAG: ribulokinase [Bacteroidetes bacterium]|nr:MAG: ribulokinase [Bacteroidota bacterium]
MKDDSFVIGVDFGTDSVRSVVVDTKSGAEVSSSTFHYPRWRDGLFCDPTLNQFRQHPKDYVEGLESTIQFSLRSAGSAVASRIKAISVDTTGSTPVAVDKTGSPLSLQPAFDSNPNAMFVLWKDHTSVAEAATINEHAKKFEIDYLRFVGGVYSSEWFWAKLLHILRVDEQVYKHYHSWVEHCDWIPFLLTGGNEVTRIKRGVCSAGHKALWSEEFGGLPPDSFFSSLDPRLKGITGRLFSKTYAADQSAGCISKVWSERLGLPPTVTIGMGAFDAHMGAVGGQIEPYYLSKVMGTSTCDMLVAPMQEMGGRLVRGICGQVPGSIIPGMLGMEAGQSAFGDAYAWFKNILSWPLQIVRTRSDLSASEKIFPLIDQLNEDLIDLLSKEAASIPVTHENEIALDWLNGRRTPEANQSLKGALMGLNLGTNTPKIFRAIVESTCFGAKAIVNCFEEQGVPVKGLIGLGGVARKSPFIMQMMSDVMNMPIRIHRSEQTCAIGAAMFAATAAGLYQKVEDAMQAMGQGFDNEFRPDKNNAAIYAQRFEKYKALGHCIEKLTP